MFLSLMAFCLSNTTAYSQNAHFVKNGIIEFEKKANMFAILKRKIDKDNESYYQPAYDAYKRDKPQFRTSKSTLYFNQDKSLYKWPEEEQMASNFGFDKDFLVEIKNTIATNFNNQTSISKKNMFEDTYLVTDSLRKIKWKITDETREIAGYNCRRANALIMDSIYVVAYYSNQIAVSGGPESFTGLPGMILGLALPHENVTWFATKVTEVAVPEKDLMPPTKGKPTDNKGLGEIIKKTMKDWGTYGRQAAKALLL